MQVSADQRFDKVCGGKEEHRAREDDGHCGGRERGAEGIETEGVLFGKRFGKRRGDVLRDIFEGAV